MSHVGMELRDETLFVLKRVGMTLVWHQPVSVHIWTSLPQSKSARWGSVSHSGSQQSGAR